MPAHSNQLEASLGGNAVDILAIGVKHSCNLRQTVGGCHNICIQFLILYRAVIGLRSIPSFKALLGHSALAQDIDHIKMPFGNQFVSSRFFQPKAQYKLLP